MKTTAREDERDMSRDKEASQAAKATAATWSRN